MKVFLVFCVTIVSSVRGDADSTLLVDLIHETLPDEIRDQLVHELQHHGPNFDLSDELHDKIRKHVTLVKSLVPTQDAINNFLSNFPDSKHPGATSIIQEALILGISESMTTKPAESANPNRRQLISPHRLQQILPDRLQRDILEELFLKGGLEHMSPELRRKVHDEMQRVRENYVLPPAAKIEQFLQHFPPSLRDELRQILEQTQASGRLPAADEELRLKVAGYMEESYVSRTKKRKPKSDDSVLSVENLGCVFDMLPNTIRNELQQIVASRDVHIVPATVDKIKLQLEDYLRKQIPMD